MAGFTCVPMGDGRDHFESGGRAPPSGVTSSCNDTDTMPSPRSDIAMAMLYGIFQFLANKIGFYTIRDLSKNQSISCNVTDMMTSLLGNVITSAISHDVTVGSRASPLLS